MKFGQDRSERQMEDVNEANGGKRCQVNPLGTIGCWPGGYHRLVR